MDVNSLPKTVTRQRRGCDLNPGPTAPESSMLTTRLPSHQSKVKYTDIAVRSRTCHTATGTHTPYRITQCVLPPDRGDISAFIPAEARTRLSDPGGMQG